MDTSNFLPREEVRRILQVSEKTLQRLVQKKALKQYIRARPGQQPITVFNPDDIEKRRASQYVAPPAQTPATPAIALDRKLWLTLREAALYSGLPFAYLKRQRDAGHLPALRIGQTWRVRRDYFERWIPDDFHYTGQLTGQNWPTLSKQDLRVVKNDRSLTDRPNQIVD